jgi:hypothetical protein
MIVGSLKSSTSRRRYRKDQCEIQLNPHQAIAAPALVGAAYNVLQG